MPVLRLILWKLLLFISIEGKSPVLLYIMEEGNFLNRLKMIFYNINNNATERSMLLSLLCKPLSMVVSFIYTPILLHYLGEEAYGIWATILSIVNWINYFDVGIANGVRNLLTVHIERQEKEEVSKDVSTAYIALFFISAITFLIGSLIILNMDLHSFFKTEMDVKATFEVSFFFICINFILSLSRIILYATHQAEKVSYMTLLTQLINLCGILLFAFCGSGNILYVAILVGMSGMTVNLFYYGRLCGKNNFLFPHFRMFSRERLRSICNVGVKFFLIQISVMILYSTDSVIITRLFGPANVTPYQTAFSAFGIVNGLYAAAVTPLWAKYAAEKERNNYSGIKKIVRTQEKFMLIVGIILLIEGVCYKPASVIWLQKELNYDPGLIIMMAVYNFCYIWSNIYAIACNGMERIHLQLYLAIIGAVINIPLSFYLGGRLHMRSTGVMLATVICMLMIAIPMAVDTHRYLNKMCRLKEDGLK